MIRFRRFLYASAFAAVGIVGTLVAPEAAAYVGTLTAPVPPSAAIYTPERLVPVKAVPNTEAATVKVILPNGLGSGVSIGNGSVLTAAHVVSDAKEVTLKLRTGEEVKAEVLWANTSYDLALLRTEAKIPAASLSCGVVHVGDAIMAVGNPLGVEFVSAFGKIAGEARVMDGAWKSAYVTDMTTIMGMSGGPVFNEQGKLIGITVGVMVAPLGKADAQTPSLAGFGYIVPSSAACLLMGRA